MDETYYKVAVNTPFNESLLHYKSDSKLKPGEIVQVPLGKRKTNGVILEEDHDHELETEKLKAIGEERLYPFSFQSFQMSFLSWMAGYYQYPLGQLFSDVLPKSLKRPRKLDVLKGKGKDFKFKLNPDQESAISQIGEHLDHFHLSLLHGITGSGKTVVYIETIKKVLLAGKSVLVLLPEINLTPQFLKVFEEYLEVEIYSYSSVVSDSQKFNLWQTLNEDSKPRLIMGARSSLFLPIQNLGLIVVDEEHDGSFKQMDRCPYHARDAAIKLASLLNIPIILGSATPSLESLYNVKEKARGLYLELNQRAGKGNLPAIELIDTTQHMDELTWPFHPESLNKIEEAFKRDEQVLVFVNRLGFASYLQCRACGHQFYCPSCSVPLKYFKRRSELKCQTCDYKAPVPDSCPACGNMKILSKGFGTERLQEILENKFPHKKISRFDRDEVTNFTELNKRLDAFHKGEIDLFVGTQMLSKGHNFERVNLVVILGTDNQLNFPDFRSGEKVVQQVMQVAGRSGRYSDKSEVVIQTLNPENSVYQLVQKHDFKNFVDQELEIRKMCQCSPFFRLCNISLTSKHQNVVIEESKKAGEVLKGLRSHFDSVEVLGPRPALIEKRANKFSWCFFVRSQDLNQLHNLIRTFKSHFKPHYSLSIKYDIDPTSFE